MSTFRIATVVGARPQFVKAAAFSKVWRDQSGCSELLIHTGQHYDQNMSDIFFKELQIPTPEISLGIGSGLHGAQTGKMLTEIEAVLLDNSVDALLVYGDTNSTLAGALAAAKLKIPVVHVEAGLRSFNREMPEEINRVLTDHVSDLLLAPTQVAVEHLKSEGVDQGAVHMVGDVMYDIALFAADLADHNARKCSELGLNAKDFLLGTIHRAENTDHPERLEQILAALRAIAKDLRVIVPIHPRTRKMLTEGGYDMGQVELIDPVGYLDMLDLTRNAKLVVTDSGGLQKEAYFHRVPCVTLRTETEWVELLEAGWNRLLAPVPNADLITGLRNALDQSADSLPPWQELYGSGDAAKRCADLVQNLIGSS